MNDGNMKKKITNEELISCMEEARKMLEKANCIERAGPFFMYVPHHMIKPLSKLGYKNLIDCTKKI